MQKWYKSQVEFEICTIFAKDVIYFGWLLVGSLGSPTKTRLFRVPASASIAPKNFVLFRNALRAPLQSLPHQKLQIKTNNSLNVEFFVKKRMQIYSFKDFCSLQFKKIYFSGTIAL